MADWQRLTSRGVREHGCDKREQADMKGHGPWTGRTRDKLTQKKKEKERKRKEKFGPPETLSGPFLQITEYDVYVNTVIFFSLIGQILSNFAFLHKNAPFLPRLPIFPLFGHFWSLWSFWSFS